MGNQYEVRQLEPFVVEWGAAVPIRHGHSTDLLAKTGELQRHYMFVVRSDEAFEIPNLDYANVRITRAGEFLCIQSGGKMWCGYREFRELLASLAPDLEDAVVYVADEEDFVDRMAIKDGTFEYQRMHSGSWCSLDDWPTTKLK